MRHRRCSGYKAFFFAWLLVVVSAAAKTPPNVSSPEECSKKLSGVHDWRSLAFKAGDQSYFLKISSVKYAGRECIVNLGMLDKKTEHSIATADFQVDDGFEFGAQFTGVSPSGGFLLIDMYDAAGDYTGHHPLVIETSTGKSRDKDLDETRIFKQLPSCDYFIELEGVLEDGSVVVHVPKSAYVDSRECRDRGRWLFNVKTGSLARVDKAHKTENAHK